MEKVKKVRAILGIIVLTIMLIALIPFLQKTMYAEKPDTPDKVALEEAYKSYDWTLEMTALYEYIVPMDNLKNQFAVRKGDKCGVIDRYGNEIVPIVNKAEKIRTDAIDGIYPICIDAYSTGKHNSFVDVYLWGFIDENGDYLVNPQYTDVQMFVGDYTAVKDTDVWQIIDINGDVIHTFDIGEYPQVTLDEGFFWVNDKGNFDIHTKDYTINAPSFAVDEPFPMPYAYDTFPLEATITYVNEDGEEIIEKYSVTILSRKTDTPLLNAMPY